ncbi:MULTISPECIES: NADPH-dependent FMN reductase [unclassified Rhizobium]|jgi:NAD(P)H-dependent FMN reductase|uniref:NADPH-dependent FMN reductase n=1 Tax=unclassified Rhizobium TaxID=2613769 RepID=UPI000649216C|nr:MULTISPECIES: NADPH-dependent FMN reductase [unclassified Rhizobium]MBN8954864.1 NAD(P)H-dependent oxidoreductase [Rhizobium tropici]OJY70705.1 MAG: NADPH-dependent FMN reductase [Rhizobium sp. 60-20]RKD52181.1 FMN reductase [Rhizobium sp. WW_1]
MHQSKMTILSCSMDPESRSSLIAREAERLLLQRQCDVDFIDLRELELPVFDNSNCYDHPSYERLCRAIRDADGVLLAVPIYNWSVGSAAKSLIELTGATGAGGRKSAWFDQIVTFVCSGGLPHSYMAYGSLAMSLMLDFKCVINPYVVYATERDWVDGTVLSDTLAARLRKTIEVKLELSSRLSSRTYSSDWEI